MNKFSSTLLSKIWYYSDLPQTSVSLRQMCQFGSHPNPGVMFKASCFILRELPIRLAHRIKELDSLPHGLNRMEDVMHVRNWYVESFRDLYNFATDLNTSHGKLYQLLYTDKSPDTLKDKHLLDRIISCLYSKSEMNDISYTTTRLNNKVQEHVNDGQCSKSIYKSLHDCEESPKGIILSPKKYYSPLPYKTTLEYNKNPDFYQFWPQEILMFNQNLLKVLSSIKERHDSTVIKIAKGVLKWKKTHQQNVDSSVQNFLDRFYLSRIGIRMLIGQHLALLENGSKPYSNLIDQEDGTYVGIICTDTNITQIAKDSIESAQYICCEHYGLFEAPKIELFCFPLNHSKTSSYQLTNDSTLSDIRFMYVPGHLHHMLFETLKNALRATVEKTIEQNQGINKYDLKFPPVKVIISEGLEDLTVKISDEGGGIARSNLPLVWTYLYTTMPEDEQIGLIDENNMATPNFLAPMAGYGYGLALSRLYARYFGGDLKLISMEGFGTDVYLHLNRLNTSSEPLQ